MSDSCALRSGHAREVARHLPHIQDEITALSITGSYYGSTTSPAEGFDRKATARPLSIDDGQQLTPECNSLLFSSSGG
ncbi:MAG: hypothetical protein WCD11_19585 [Solirubrobacteraceae bacterium]